MKIAPSIQKIVRECILENPKYQRVLLDTYSPLLFSICLRYMGNREKAKDALQESFIKIFKYIKTYDLERGQFESWLRKITINQCLKSISKEKIPIISINEFVENTSKVFPNSIANLDAEFILKIIQTIPNDYRQIFNLAIIDGYKHKEIAKILGIQESSSRAKLSRAKAMIKSKICKISKSEAWIETI